MKQYRRESELSKDVMRELRACGDVFATRIESGSTCVGIPDIYYTCPREQGWIELKLGRCAWTGTCKGIRWKPTQVQWALTAFRHKATCYTLVAFTDCYCLITMDRAYRPDSDDKLVHYKKGQTISEVLQ